AAGYDVARAIADRARRMPRTPFPRDGHREIAVDSAVDGIEPEAAVEARWDVDRNRSVDGLEVHVVIAAKRRHPGVDVSVHRLRAHRTNRGVDVYAAVHSGRPHRTAGVTHGHTPI